MQIVSELDHCSRCGQPHIRTNISYCRDCNREMNNAWRDEHREEYNDYFRRYFSDPENKIRHKARLKYYAAYRSGKIIRPDHCEVCGRKGPVEAHHCDYSRPLDVVHLCSWCHTELGDLPEAELRLLTRFAAGTA